MKRVFSASSYTRVYYEVTAPKFSSFQRTVYIKAIKYARFEKSYLSKLVQYFGFN